MFIRLFANTSSSDEALQILETITNNMEFNIESKEIVKIEPYWKIEGVYVVEVDIKLSNSLNEKDFKHFLDKIADKWTFFGDPVNEALASDTTQGCNYIKKGLAMINIFY